MKKACLIILCALIALPTFAATSATLREIKGKVEVKPLGKAWVEAKEGMTIDLLATISTGFNSSAMLLIADNKIAVAPLTRLTVDKIVEQAGTLGTNLHLRVGKVSAEVKSSSSTPQDFKVTSPYSTASVRGTIFEYDGFVLDVQDGTVTFVPGRPPRDIATPTARPRPSSGTGDATPAGGESGTTPPEVVQPEDYGLADFMAALQEEFPDDSFELSDESGQPVEPATPPAGSGQPTPPAPPRLGIPVGRGGSLVLQLDHSTPGPGTGPAGGLIRTGRTGGYNPLVGTTGAGDDEDTEQSGLPLPPLPPTTGRIKITITQP